MVTVEYWMMDNPKSSKSFDSHAEASAFMSALASNPNCEAYGIAR